MEELGLTTRGEDSRIKKFDENKINREKNKCHDLVTFRPRDSSLKRELREDSKKSVSEARITPHTPVAGYDHCPGGEARNQEKKTGLVGQPAG